MIENDVNISTFLIQIWFLFAVFPIVLWYIFAVFLIICILCVISMPVVSLSERIVLLFDGYRYARFNLFDFSRVVILRLLPIYLIGFSFSSSLSVNCDYFKLRLYRYSIWHNAINCAFASLIAIFIALQLLLASTLPFSSGQSSQEALFNVSPLVLILVIITVFMELFAATLCFFNCYLCTSNSVLSFILIFFIYLLFLLHYLVHLFLVKLKLPLYAHFSLS